MKGAYGSERSERSCSSRCASIEMRSGQYTDTLKIST